MALAIRGLAAGPYWREAIDGWVPDITDQSLHELAINDDAEIRLIAELDGTPVGIGALVVSRSELRACYVAPEATRRGCGSALVAEIERLARSHGLTHLELAGSLNAEAFYASLRYRVRETEVGLIRSRGHCPKGGYDVHTDGRNSQEATIASPVR